MTGRYYRIQLSGRRPMCPAGSSETDRLGDPQVEADLTAAIINACALRTDDI